MSPAHAHPQPKLYMRRIGKFYHRGSNFDNVFLDGREDPSKYLYKHAIIDRQRNTILVAFSWRANNGPKLNAGLVAMETLGDPGQYN